MRYIWVWLILFSPVAKALTFPQAVQKALSQSSVLKQQELQLQRSKLSIKQDKAAFLPSLDLTSSYLFTEDNPTTRTYAWDSSAALQVTQNFYDHGVSLNNYALSQTRARLTELDYRREKSATVLRTAQLYFEVLKAQKIEELQKRNTQLVEKVFRLIESQYRQGIRKRQDFLRFESQRQRSILAQSSASFDVFRSIEELKVYLNEPALVGPFQDYSATAFVKQNDVETYEVSKARLTNELRRQEEKTAALENRPKIDIVGRLGYGSDSYFRTDSSWNDNDRSFWNVGLTLNWNLWDWGQRRAVQDSARLETLRQQYQTNLEQRSADSEIEKIRNRIGLVKEQFDIASALQKVENESYQIMEISFREGRTSFLDYSDSLGNVISAQIQKIQAEYNLIYVNLELEHRKGYLDESSIQ